MLSSIKKLQQHYSIIALNTILGKSTVIDCIVQYSNEV